MRRQPTCSLSFLRVIIDSERARERNPLKELDSGAGTMSIPHEIEISHGISLGTHFIEPEALKLPLIVIGPCIRAMNVATNVIQIYPIFKRKKERQHYGSTDSTCKNGKAVLFVCLFAALRDE
jgi:hypothetical protein